MSRIALLLVTLLVSIPCLVDASAGADAPLRGEMWLKHVDSDHWQVRYRFEQPIDRLHLGAPIVHYRQRAWKVTTPALSLRHTDENESIGGNNRPFDQLDIELAHYLPWSHDAYVPMDVHSDGGTALYLGHFMGEVEQQGKRRELALTVHAESLSNEQVLLPQLTAEGRGVYAYFGPQEIQAIGPVQLVLDPATPNWMRQVVQDGMPKLADYFGKHLGRRPKELPAVMIGARELDQPGYSIKGGALPGQLVFTLAGSDLLADSDIGRQAFEHLLAHELAHVWQDALTQGGIGEGEPWVHEGGAEALSAAALAGSGVWSEAQAAAFKANLINECLAAEGKHRQQPELPVEWREHYTCGYRRFAELGIDPVKLWATLIDASESSGEAYSSQLLQRVVAKFKLSETAASD